MLSKTNFSFKASRLNSLLPKVVWDDKNRCQINYPLGNWLYDPYEIKEIWKGTALEELLNLVSTEYPIGEARLIRLTPGDCYLSHTDVDDRIHINLTGNDQSYLINLDNQTMYKTVPDDIVYYMDASHKHVAANFGSKDRIQLVIRIRLKRIDKPQFSTRIIKFKSFHETFRYDFDNNISNLISKKIKQGKIGFFDFNTEELFIKSDEDSFKDILNHIESISKDFEIL